MGLLASITESFGVRIDATNSLVQAAVYAVLVAGVAAIAAPVISTIRVLLSLFVLPGQPVRSGCLVPRLPMPRLHNPKYSPSSNTPTSSPHLVPAAPGPS